MSGVPDKCKRGYRSSRDERPSAEKNIRLKCPYCPKDGLLYASYGRHIFKEHQDLMFLAENTDSKNNRKLLFSKASLKEPVMIQSPKGLLSWCFGCQSCFQNHKKAESHLTKWKDCQRIHQENIFTLREEYPLTAATVPTVLKKKQQLNKFLDDVLEKLRHAEQMANIDPWNFKEEYEEHFADWGLDLDEEELRKGWMFVLEEKPKEDTPAPTPPSEPEEDDLIPLVVEKPLTKIQLIQKQLNDPDTTDEDKAYLRQEMYKEFPHLKPQPVQPQQTSAFPKAKRVVKLVDQTQDTPPAPALALLPVPEDQADFSRMEAWQKMSHWDRFKQQNPGKSVQELNIDATHMLRKQDVKDATGGLKIIQSTKRPTQQN